jgi:serine/threonine protein kinase/DNA-binding transcriptional regulator YiaG
VIAKYGKFEYVLAEHYRFEDELGRGAMGTVYRAQDVKLGRPVAIKMLHPMLTNELGVARFQSEIRIAAGLHHPNIIGVHDSGEADGRLFYVMDYLGGETLRDRLKREKQLSVEDAIRIVEQVAEGLQYAHDHGVIHRDVKPENILLAEGRACVVDFGLARALGDVNTERLTASGLSVGTPHYLSPEQATAEKDVGPKADQYSLACVLYEMLVGEPPFTGPTATSIAMRHISEAPTPLRVRRHTTPIGVEVAVTRAMEKVPADRFASMKEFAQACRARKTMSSVKKARSPKTLIRRATLVSAAVVTAAVLLSVSLARSGSVSASVVTWPLIGSHFKSGQQALRAGHLTLAVQELRAASRKDTSDALAALWLSQALLMAGQDTSTEWRTSAEAALQHASALPPSDIGRARAVAALAQDKYAIACPAFRALRATTADPILTFELAECLARDAAVIPDSARMPGWRFRSDPGEAIAMYREVLRQVGVGPELRYVVLSHIPRLLTTEWGQYRKGIAYDDSSRQFGAFPALTRGASGDSIVYEPHPLTEFRTGRPWMNPPTLEAALDRQRALLREVGASLVKEYPSSSVSHETFARALELSGELTSRDSSAPTALREIIAARRNESSPDSTFALRVTEVRLLIKTGDFAAARSQADSALAQWSTSGERPSSPAETLLALTGQGDRLAALLKREVAGYTERMPDGHRFHPHPVLGAAALEFSVWARVGLRRDSLAVLLSRVETALNSFAARQARDSVRIALIARALSSSVPIIPAQQAYARGDRHATKTILDSLIQIRAGHATAGARVDQVYQEAWLRLSIGDTVAATAQLDGALNGLPATGTLFLGTMSEAAALTHAMMLRADLASQHGDQDTATRWKSAAEALLQQRRPRA